MSAVKAVLTVSLGDYGGVVAVELEDIKLAARVDDVLLLSMYHVAECAMIESVYGPVAWVSNRFGEA